MTIQELDELRDSAVERIFRDRGAAEKFFLLVSRLWRHSPDNMLVIYMQDDEAKAVAGKRAFEAQGMRLKDSEKPLFIYNTVIRQSDDGLVVDARTAQAYDIRQFEELGAGKAADDSNGLRMERSAYLESETETYEDGRSIDVEARVKELCGDEGISIMEVDRMPQEAGYYSGYFDEEEQAIIVCRDVKRELKTSAILYGFVQFVFSREELSEDMAEIADKAGRDVREDAELLALYCVERYLGRRGFVSDPGLIVENVVRKLLSFEDRRKLISCVCRGVQDVLRQIEGCPFSVEDTNVVNSLLISGDRQMLLKLYGEIMQSGIRREEKALIARVFEDILGRMTDKELEALYDARINRRIYTYPAFKLEECCIKG